MALTIETDARLEYGVRLSHPPPGDEVLITGVSGYFPDSDSVHQLQEHLFNKVDLVTSDDRRWKPHPGVPHWMGKINNVNKFDASFFGIPSKQAHAMDPVSRMLLQKTYEAVFDAGVNPNELRNTNTGVFIGACFTESESALIYERDNMNKYGIVGCSRAMLANRISYWLGVTGPSYTVDSACSSSLFAVEHAFRAIRDGLCDAAIVGGTHLCLHPHFALLLAKLGVLSPDGRCKSFDDRGSGYVRSEAIVVVFLQKAKHSRRVYMQIVHAKTNCNGFIGKGITHPSGKVQKQLLEELYEECSVLPHTVEFVEAHGTGTVVGDTEELSAIDQVFCPGRSEPLNIGSVKSNLGHAEPASGLVSIAKMCISYHTGHIPPNLLFESPRKSIPALIENRLKVLTEKTPWKRGLSGICSFGFGGGNAHVLVKNFAKEKVNNGLPDDILPRLVCVSGRTESAVSKILDDLKSRSVDVEFVRLLHAIHDEDIKGHVYRGYTILGSTPSKSVPLCHSVSFFSGAVRAVWFVYPGLGSQWPGMGHQLMDIPVFAAAIHKCHAVLEPKGINLTAIITDRDPKIFDNILNSFIGIAAMQIGLTDVLRSIGIEPDYIIGHSVGELGCAYADGCFTAEQMILAAYSRGLVSVQTQFVKGSMYGIGVGYNEAKSKCPPEVEVACHNGPDTCTISGPAEAMDSFVATLTAEGIFTKKIQTSNIAYHSRCIQSAGPALLQYLQEVIPDPKPRSEKWLSTSVPESQWKDPKHALSSAEYHTNNFLSPVLFEETSRQIHPNAITIEIAPHGLLQATLRRSLKKEVLNIPLMQRNNMDTSKVLLSALGKLYESGLNPHLASLYPAVSFPVSQGTPMLSHLVEWDHSDDWFVMSYESQKKNFIERTIKINVNDEENQFLTTHKICGDNMYHAPGYLVLVWETLALLLDQKYTELSVVFENVRFPRDIIIPKDGNLEFVVMVQKNSGNFEISEGGVTIATGFIYAKSDIGKEYAELPSISDFIGSGVNMITKDVYKEFGLRRYHYGSFFRGIQECNAQFTRARVSWFNNWVTFIDSILQLKIIATDTRGVLRPANIERLSIDTAMHYSSINSETNNKTSFEVFVESDDDVTRAGGVEVRGYQLTPLVKNVSFDKSVLEKNMFVPNYGQNKMDIENILRIDIQIIIENITTLQMNIIELIDVENVKNGFEPLLEIVGAVFDDVPIVQAELTLISEKSIDMHRKITVKNQFTEEESNADLFIGANLLKRPEIVQKAAATLRNKCFIISREKSRPDSKQYADKYDTICIHDTGVQHLVLLRRRAGARPAKYIRIQNSDQTYAWIEEVKKYLEEGQKLVLYSQDEPINGLLGLVNCLRKEPGGEIVYGLLIADPSAPAFNFNLEFYKKQLDKDLTFNVYQNGEWGTYRHLLIGKQETVSAENAYLNTTAVDDISSLKWIQGPLKEDHINTHNKNLIHVYCASVNSRDVMIASGEIAAYSVSTNRLQQERLLGTEIAGRKPDGTRVMGIVQGGLSSLVEEDKALTWPIPDKWSYEEAATVPAAYSTAYYALVVVGRLQRGESILIHAGSGDVGQAAINVALHYGCEIFTTVGTAEKRAFTKKLFPQLKDTHIGSYGDTTFADMVKRETKAKGVEIVFDTLADDKVQASIRCLRCNGQYLQLNSFDDNRAVGSFTKTIFFHKITVDFSQQSPNLKKTLQELVQEGINDGVVRPLTYLTFKKHEAEAAFRHVIAGQHSGKVIIRICNKELTDSLESVSPKMEAVPRYLCQKDQVYILVGGLGGFGIELADWLILRGARKIVLVSRHGVVSGYQAYRLRLWSSYGVKVHISTDDVTTQAGCEAMLRTANTMGPVAAIFNLAVVLQDRLFQNQTPECYMSVCGPKAVATVHLDKLSRIHCPELRDFVVFSSKSCGRGNAGQTNYGLANSVMERICEERKKFRLPALAVQWGPISDVGILEDSKEENTKVVLGGCFQQKIASCLEALDRFLKQEAVVVSSMIVAEKKTDEEKVKARTVADAIAKILSIKDLKTVSLQRTLADLGMDSMTAVEIKHTLERDFQIFLCLKDIRNLTIVRLTELSTSQE